MKSYNSYLEYLQNHNDFKESAHVKIRQSDITNNSLYHYITNDTKLSGTLQLCNPGKYEIVENITFNYNTDFFCSPTPLQASIKIPESLTKRNYNQKYLFPTFKYNGPFDYGFFAGITIDGDNIEIISNNKTLQMSPQMHLIQRFFAIICLGSSPFIAKKGPMDTGTDQKYPKNTVIKNITFGLSSHHGILGNETNNTKILNCTFKDFETAAISLNNCDKVCINKNNILNNFQKVPVNSNFFSFVLQTKMAVLLDLSIKDKFLKIYTKIFIEFQNTGKVLDPEFTNTTNGLTDAIAMGILISQKGPSTDQTNICNPQTLKITSHHSENVRIFNTTIKNIKAQPLQTTAVYFNDKPISISNAKLFYISKNAHTQKLFLQFVASLSLKSWNEIKSYFNPTTLTPEIAGKLLENPYQFKFYCNADIMNHLLKPVFGIRIQYTKKIILKNIDISKIGNYSPIYIKHNDCVKHPKTECLNPNDTIGLLISNSTYNCTNTKIRKLYSKNGKTIKSLKN